MARCFTNGFCRSKIEMENRRHFRRIPDENRIVHIWTNSNLPTRVFQIILWFDNMLFSRNRKVIGSRWHWPPYDLCSENFILTNNNNKSGLNAWMSNGVGEYAPLLLRPNYNDARENGRKSFRNRTTGKTAIHRSVSRVLRARNKAAGGDFSMRHFYCLQREGHRKD